MFKLIVNDLLIIVWKNSILRSCFMRLQVITGGLPWRLLMLCSWSAPCGCAFFELVCLELDMLILKDISHVKKFLHFVNSVQEGLYIEVPTKRRNLNLHLIFIRTLVTPSPIMIRKRKFSYPVGIRIGHSPRVLLVNHPSIVSLIFEVVFLIEGVV